MISESELSHQAAADALPFQDAFAVLFFVSVGMLFDPTVLLEESLHVAMTVLIVMVDTSAAAFGIVLRFRYPVRSARTDVLDVAGVARARLLVIAAPDAFQSRRIFELARKANPALQVIVRTHSEAEQRYIEQQGACIAVMGERQLALGMARFALAELKVDAEQIEAVLGELRETAVSAGTLVSRGLAT